VVRNPRFSPESIDPLSSRRVPSERNHSSLNPVANRHSAIQNQQFFYGVLAQLVERLNGIECEGNSLTLSQTARFDFYSENEQREVVSCAQMVRKNFVGDKKVDKGGAIKLC
jgi:hypothetical protein